MKHIYLMALLALTCVSSSFAATVKVTMNAVSTTMTLADKATGNAVEVGEAANRVYTFEAPAGTYVLTAYATNGTTVNGTIELNVTEEAEQEFGVLTCTAFATNKNWAADADYTVSVNVASKFGEARVQTIGESVTAGRKTFLAFTGDSYNAELIPSEEHAAENYLSFYKGGTLTSNTNVSGAIPTGADYSVTVPADANLQLGIKFAHFMPFFKVEPKSIETVGDNKVYSYTLAVGQQYNYRTWKKGGLTQGGLFYMQAEAEKCPQLVFTNDDFAAQSPKFIDKDVKNNGGYNVADVYLNINPQNHLKLNVGDKFDLTGFRNWQLIESTTNNYFIDPDYHYTVQSITPAKEAASIITLDNPDTTTDTWTTLEAVGEGTAIVTVTYDAIGLHQYANNSTAKTPYVGGEFWSALWPENTGVFVVTVGNNTNAITPNFLINEGKNVVAEKMAGDNIDADFDVFYYAKGTNGYEYTFKPEGAANVMVAYPTIGESIATYSGFASEGVKKNEDGSYTVLLKAGRQIIAVYDESGNAEYQVMNAKEVEYTLENTTRPGSSFFMPGEQVAVKFNNLYHPANKLAGIHNFSAVIDYANVPEGGSAKGTANQYLFVSTDAAQTLAITLPETVETETVSYAGGTIKVTGFGDPIGNHRSTSRTAGRNANFTAVQHTCFFGNLPVIEVPVTQPKDFDIAINCNVEGAKIVITKDGKTVEPAENGSYSGSFGTYYYAASAKGYKYTHGTMTIADDAEGVQTININMPSAGEGAWDGVSISEPSKNEDGAYVITNGDELAWFANEVNVNGNLEIVGVLNNDIELAGYPWTPIGGDKQANAFKGDFDGQNHTVNGLYINSDATYQGLFGYTCGPSADNFVDILNLSVNGSVTSTANYVAAIAPYPMRTNIINCNNDADVSGKQYVGGVAGNLYTSTVVDRCTNTGDVTGTGTYVGGVVAYLQNSNAKVYNSVNMGTVTGTTNVGGVMGSNGATCVAENLLNTGIVNGTTVGAIAGGTTKKTNFKNCFAAVEYDITEGQTTVTEEQLASGEVAYLLGEAFGQAIGVETVPALGGMKVYFDETTGTYTNEEPQPEVEGDYELRVLTFEDADYQGGKNFAGGNDWSSLIDDPQYGGSLLYGDGMGYYSEEEAYKWYDQNNTELAHTILEGWGSWCYWTGGHAISNYGSGDQATYGSYDSQLTVYSKGTEGLARKGMGHNGSDNFAVHYGYTDNSGYSGTSLPALSFNDGEARVIDHMYVTNTCYAMNAYMSGNGLTDKIGKDDWVKLVATGYNAKGVKVKQTAEIYLVNGPENVITDWTKWDLSVLGKVSRIEINVTGSSDNGFGFSQPAYFAYDDVAVRFPIPAIADFEDIAIEGEGFVAPEDEEYEVCYWNSGDYTFSTYTDDWGVKYYYDWVVTNSKSDKYETITDQYNSAAGGAKSGDNYAVWYSNFYGNEAVWLPAPMKLSGFYVTNTAWVEDAILNGDGMTPGAFGKGDNLKLIVTGYDMDNNATGTVEVMLADCTGDEWTYIKDWRWVDLTSLGDQVVSVNFEMTSTKSNAWGMTTPAYFCIDDFGGIAPKVQAPLAVIDQTPYIASILADLTTTIEEANGQLAESTSTMAKRILTTAIADAEKFVSNTTIYTTAEEIAAAVDKLRSEMQRAADYEQTYTDIDSLIASSHAGAKIYDLQGRTVTTFKRGNTYIVNGKKYIAK